MSDFYIGLHSIGCPHASEPEYRARVLVFERSTTRSRKTAPRWIVNDAESTHYLLTPTADTWTPDTLRLVLHELSGYLPAHDRREATATVSIDGNNRNARVTLSVEARGWRADYCLYMHHSPWRADQFTTTDEWKAAIHQDNEESTRDFSEPMVSYLRAVAAQSPIGLVNVVSPLSERPHGRLVRLNDDNDNDDNATADKARNILNELPDTIQRLFLKMVREAARRHGNGGLAQ